MLKVGITHGLRGHFAVLYDQDGPIQSGIGSYATPKEAAAEAQDWAEAEEIALDEDCQKLLGLNLGNSHA